MYYGEGKCQANKKSGEQCINNAYWKYNEKYYCGVHCGKSKIGREQLPMNPNKKDEDLKLLKDRQNLVEEQAKLNKKGNVIVSKMNMMKPPLHVDGYLKVFPNYKHENRVDGFGCASLSPKSLGPIDHGMPNLPISKNLENYHQGAKIFKFEVNENNEIKPESLKYREKMYEDPIPYRHKYSREQLNVQKGENINIPLFSVYYDKEGKEKRYTYLECRYFYCHWYEKLVKNLPAFLKLKKFINDGYNLQIIGYDGYHVDKDLYSCYLDTSKPFGHELVLYTLLVEEDCDKYPWNIFYHNNKKIYKGVI